MFFPTKEWVFARGHFCRFLDEDSESLWESLSAQDNRIGKVFDKYLDRIEFQETFSGRKRYEVKGLLEDVNEHLLNMRIQWMLHNSTEEGWWDLQNILALSKEEATRKFIGLGGTTTIRKEQPKELARSISSIMNLGMLSTEQRRFLGYAEYGGLGAHADEFGSENSVFLQMLSANMTPEESFYSGAFFSNRVRLEIDPTFIQLGSYQYHKDKHGTKVAAEKTYYTPNIFHYLRFYFQNESMYLHRDNIMTFIARQFLEPTSDHEIMVEGELPPKYIRAIFVQSEKERQELIACFRKQGELIDEKIFGRNIDDFIKVEQKKEKNYALPKPLEFRKIYQWVQQYFDRCYLYNSYEDQKFFFP